MADVSLGCIAAVPRVPPAEEVTSTRDGGAAVCSSEHRACAAVRSWISCACVPVSQQGLEAPLWGEPDPQPHTDLWASGSSQTVFHGLCLGHWKLPV